MDGNHVDWVQIASWVWAIIATVIVPILAKRSATFAALLKVVVQGVEKGGDQQTKAAIQNVAVAAGVQGQLAPIVTEITKPVDVTVFPPPGPDVKVVFPPSKEPPK